MYDSYLKSLIDYADNIGVTEEVVMLLYENGFDEELLYSPEILQECIEEMAKIIYA